MSSENNTHIYKKFDLIKSRSNAEGEIYFLDLYKLLNIVYKYTKNDIIKNAVKLFINNIDKENFKEVGYYKLGSMSMSLIINNYLNWSKTKEGHKFWSILHKSTELREFYIKDFLESININLYPDE